MGGKGYASCGLRYHYTLWLRDTLRRRGYGRMPYPPTQMSTHQHHTISTPQHLTTSIHRNVEAALLNLVLNEAPLLLAHIAEHLREHPLQRVVAHLSAARSVGVRHGVIAVVADVERGAVEVARVLGGVRVAAA